eukprot:4300026-Prymnesium_polylepis.1
MVERCSSVQARRVLDFFVAPQKRFVTPKNPPGVENLNSAKKSIFPHSCSTASALEATLGVETAHQRF